MFSKTIELAASKREFVFSSGGKEVRFCPVVYLSSDKKVLAIGSPPMAGGVAREARVFEEEQNGDALDLLETMMRYGVREVIGGWIVGRLTISVRINADIRRDLKGFAPSVFRSAGMNSGAAKVIVQ